MRGGLTTAAAGSGRRSRGAKEAGAQPLSPGRETTGAVWTWETTGGALSMLAAVGWGPQGSAGPGMEPVENREI